MKVSALIKVLQEGHTPDEDIIVLWWSNPEEFAGNSTLSDENWNKICLEFDEWDNAGADISDWVATAISEYYEEA